MDTSTIIIGLIMVALCALPFILSSTNRKSSEQTIKKAIFELAQKNNTSILQNDFWYKTAIGINTTNYQLFFYRKTKDLETSEIIDLSNYKKCSVIKLNDNSNHIDVLQLVLAPNTTKNKEVILDFYNSEYNPQLNGEVQLIEKWSKIINETIYNTTTIKKAV